MRRALYVLVMLSLTLVAGAEASEPGICDASAFDVSQEALPVEFQDGSELITYASGACEVTRYCDYPPPTMVTCSSEVGDCDIGATYVVCDGEFYACSPPPSPECSPDCDDVNGSFCKSGSTTCEMAIGGECQSFNCNCWNNQWACP